MVEEHGREAWAPLFFCSLFLSYICFNFLVMQKK